MIIVSSVIRCNDWLTAPFQLHVLVDMLASVCIAFSLHWQMQYLILVCASPE